ncbi:MAG: transglycosylase family protein [Acidimicrobiia bacterium]|nr:transglycosylase family protein [Acidimicrobiia bacterium]
MAEQMAAFARARGAGVWFSASPRVQRLAAISVAASLATALAVAAVHHRPASVGGPMALAATTAPVVAPVAVADEAPPVQVRPVKAVRPSGPQQEKRPQAPADRGWEYWSARIRGCESHGRPDAAPDYKAQNPQSTASGAYQITDGTWAGRYGLQHASDATPAQQDAAAAELYRRHGTVDWAASAACWGT